MKDMLKGKNIICISSIDWDFIWQQHQSIMSSLARNGNRVLFIENTGVRAPHLSDMPRLKKRILSWLKSIKGFRKEMDNLFVYSPLIVPLPYFRLARWINRYLMFKPLFRWMKVMDFNDPVIWTFLPTPLVLDLVEAMPHELFVYYCCDNFSATSKEARKIAKYEKMVLKTADVVFVMANNLLELYKDDNQNITCIPMGVDTELFEGAQKASPKPWELKNIQGRIIGYIGGVRQSVDQELIEYLAKNLPEYTFVFIGPIQTDIHALGKYKNLSFIGQKPHAKLPDYLKYFDSCIIPYKKDEYTDNVSAAKLNEYLIMGKPVVSTNLNEIVKFNEENGKILHIADNYADFLKLLTLSIKNDNESLKEARKEAARKNSWESKIKLMSAIIEKSILKKREGTENWQEKFIKVYRDIRKKVLSVGLIVVLAWLLLFYTPLVWFCAGPLKVSEPVHKTDAIVVFAGGVGESGKSAQGYEERVAYAVDLYNRGYAKNMIFSSGYTYVFKEAEIMKALAVSLGVPQEAIILEENAKNTYENVKFSKEILDKMGWHDVLLVSSPYHMLRLKLVFNKSAPDIKISSAPIPKSYFYSRQAGREGKDSLKQITLRQLRGILHEYIAILYYFIKGYV